jgi:hypothetical protein
MHTEGVARVLQGCYKGVTRVLQGFTCAPCKGHSECTQRGCFKGVTRVSRGCHKGVTRVLQGCYKGVCVHLVRATVGAHTEGVRRRGSSKRREGRWPWRAASARHVMVGSM